MYETLQKKKGGEWWEVTVSCTDYDSLATLSRVGVAVCVCVHVYHQESMRGREYASSYIHINSVSCKVMIFEIHVPRWAVAVGKLHEVCCRVRGGGWGTGAWGGRPHALCETLH